ncbi:MAG: hypothetical protein DCO95_10935 [Roseivirga sp. XM-24bin3]|jgi:YD repeat-containing protein|nr:MAG: hypothetical protein DCO95_10935 [Roseivirga sp. XM-24bin3]
MKMNHTIEKHITVVLLLFFLIEIQVSVLAQDIPNVIPPSPEAASIVGYGNNNVSYYTGNAQVSFPITEVQGSGISIPIYMNYSGSGGIRVEQVASWVGLGWTLNSGGVISRTIRGRVDDQNGYGYTSLPALTSLSNSNVNLYQDFADGIKDPEPDEFNFSVNGYSGSFFIRKDGSIFFKPISEVKVIPHYTATGEIEKFELIVPSGERYTFSQKETNRSKTVLTHPSDNLYKTTSWYLTKIENASRTDEITLTYTTSYSKNVSFSPLSIKTTSGSNGDEDITRIFTETNLVFLDSIKSSQHIVVFEKASTNRLDLNGGKYLKRIRLLNAAGDPIRRYKFDYSYFSANGVIPENGTASNSNYWTVNTGDYELRLRLDKVTECNSDESECLPGYQFIYNSDEFLPSRYSYSQDHWGYFNGKTSNTTLEPVYRLKWFMQGEGVDYYDEFGSADRSPVETKAKAAILKEVIYPTGGSTKYEYELHDAEHDDLPNNTILKSYNLSTTNSASTYDQTITVMAESSPFEIITVNVDALPYDNESVGSNCIVIVDFYNTSDQIVTSASLSINDSPPFNYSEKVFLEAGTYKIKAYLSHCNTNLLYGCNVNYQDEVTTYKKKVGGLRIKKIRNRDGLGEETVREFFYDANGDGTGLTSTGKISSIPKYGHNYIFNISLNPYSQELVSMGYRRTVSTSEPLAYTNGSAVGYSKVTVYDSGASNNGKTEYYYSTPEDFPDFKGGSYSIANIVTYPGVEDGITFPITQIDNRDYLRGKLLKEIIYRYDDGSSTYKKLKEKEIKYTVLFPFPRVNDGSLQGLDYQPYTDHYTSSGFESIKGLRFDPGYHNRYKKYEIYTARIEPYETIVWNFDADNENKFIKTIQQNKFSSADLSNGVYLSRGLISTNSDNKTYESNLYYSFDNLNISNLSTAERTAYENMVSANIIGVPIQTEQKVGTALVSTSRTSFFGPGFISTLSTSKGNNALEPRVRYHQYDSRGNPQEISQEDGTHIVYLWGYNSSLPVAKIENATWSDVLGVVNQNILDDLTKTDGEIRTELNKLRSDPGLSNALITTITYNLGIGMTSQTTPNGLTTTYHYDSFGRLSYVKDSNGNILKKNEYVYQSTAGATNN